mmetsp:Transcript_2800/g.8019  ORF Transcript_2800/g.8019 Transcript_2800/m.8019 type:complete len:306 (-) Transcript_2800:1342-2259(-)
MKGLLFTILVLQSCCRATNGFVSHSSRRKVVWSALTQESGPSPPQQLTRLFADSEGNARVRFSGTEGLTSTTTNPLDAALTFLASDIVSIILGMLGLVVIVGHRLSLLDDTSAESLTVQTRTDLLAVFACGSVLLNGITKLDVTAAMAEAVVLEGTTLSEAEINQKLSQSDESTISWALESLITATPAKTAVVLDRSDGPWTVLARAGTVPSGREVPESTPILDRVSGPGNKKETYLPTLQALPGKRELPYLPANAQLALMVPIAEDGAVSTSRVLVLGSNQAKSFSPRDVAWCKIVAERMASTQ